MKILFLVLSGCALVSGIVAAWHWYQSSKVEVRYRSIDILTLQPDDPKRLEAGLLSSIYAFKVAAALNAKAALWSAAAVVFGAVSGVVGLWASN
jgi:hypothetical protein